MILGNRFKFLFPSVQFSQFLDVIGSVDSSHGEIGALIEQLIYSDISIDNLHSILDSLAS